MGPVRWRRSAPTSAFIAVRCILRNVGIGPSLLEIAFRGSRLEISRASFRLDRLCFLGLCLSWQERGREVIATFARRRSATFLFGQRSHGWPNCCSSFWSSTRSRPRTSLGYFMTPIVNVLLGAFYFARATPRLADRVHSQCFGPRSYLSFWLRPFPVIRARRAPSFGL